MADEDIQIQITDEDECSINIEDTDSFNINFSDGLPPTQLNDLIDVTISTPTNEQILVYNSTNAKWENKDPSVIEDVTWSDITGDQSDINISGFTNDSGFISEVNWGEITGTLSNQTDLQNELNNKLNNQNSYNLDTEVFQINSGFIHAFIKVNNSLFCGTRTTPPKIIKVRDVNNMASGGTDEITLTGKQYCEAVTYNETNKKLYFLLVNEILELNPETMTYTIFPISVTGGTGGSGGITNDGTYYYVLSYNLTNSRIAKFTFNGTTFTRIAEQILSNRPLGHCLQYDKETGFLFGSGASNTAWVAKINRDTLATTTMQVPSHAVFTDDLAIAPDYIFCVTENSPNFKIVRFNKSDLAYKIIDTEITNSGFACVYNKYDNCVYTVFNTSPGSYLKLNLRTNELRKYTADTGNNSLNEILIDEYRLFLTTWSNPAKIIRTAIPLEEEVRILKSNGTVGYRYTEGTLTVDNIVGNGSGLTNIAKGNEGDIQFSSSTGQLDYSSDLNYLKNYKVVKLGENKLVPFANKVGVLN